MVLWLPMLQPAISQEAPPPREDSLNAPAESEADRQSVSTGGAILQFLIALWHTTDVAAIGIGAMVNN